MSRQSIRLDRSLVTPNGVRIVATPVGGRGRASTGRLIVQPGQIVEFTISPLLSASSVLLR